jgi:hypothetical protein
MAKRTDGRGKSAWTLAGWIMLTVAGVAIWLIARAQLPN